MSNLPREQVVGIPISSVTHEHRSPERPASVPEPVNPFILPPNRAPQFEQGIININFDHEAADKVNLAIDWMNKIGKRADRLAKGVCEHVRMAPNFSEAMIGKLSLGASILQSGGFENVFRQNFSVGEREILLKACQCYLSTTTGPIAGLLFISTEKIAFCSERSLTFTCSETPVRAPYKIMIPLRQISRADPSENVNRPTEKYIHIVTADNFEFWFMGFVDYQKAFKYLQGAIYQSSVHHPQ